MIEGADAPAQAQAVAVEQVRIEQTTENFEYDRGVGGSRTTRLIGRMIELMTQRLQSRHAALSRSSTT